MLEKIARFCAASSMLCFGLLFSGIFVLVVIFVLLAIFSS